jgi:hypothetical protein
VPPREIVSLSSSTGQFKAFDVGRQTAISSRAALMLIDAEQLFL